MRIGFIGLGVMGRPMARNLLAAGHELVVSDFNKTAAEELIDLGAIRGGLVQHYERLANTRIKRAERSKTAERAES